MIGERLELRAKLWALVLTQRGYFTARQALDIGYSYQAQKYHADRGSWLRVDRGLFRVSEWRQDDDDHYARWALWSSGAGVVSHASAVEFHGLGDVNPSRVHMSVPRGFRRRSTGVVLHWTVPVPAQIETHDGFSVSTPLQALAESAEVSPHWLEGAVADALDRRVVTGDQLVKSAAAISPVAAQGIQRILKVVG